jgi:hypothetical protein
MPNTLYIICKINADFHYDLCKSLAWNFRLICIEASKPKPRVITFPNTNYTGL